MLPGKRRPQRIDADTILAVAGYAGLSRCKRRCIAATGFDRCRAERCQVSRNVLNVLVAEAACMGLHRWMLARAVTIAPDRRHYISRLLAAQLGNPV